MQVHNPNGSFCPRVNCTWWHIGGGVKVMGLLPITKNAMK